MSLKLEKTFLSTVTWNFIQFSCSFPFMSCLASSRIQTSGRKFVDSTVLGFLTFRLNEGRKEHFTNSLLIQIFAHYQSKAPNNPNFFLRPVPISTAWSEFMSSISTHSNDPSCCENWNFFCLFSVANCTSRGRVEKAKAAIKKKKRRKKEFKVCSSSRRK